MIIPPRAFFSPLSSCHRVRTGLRKPGKSWNLGISFSRPGKPWNLIVGPSTPRQIEVLFRRLVTTDDNEDARTARILVDTRVCVLLNCLKGKKIC